MYLYILFSNYKNEIKIKNKKEFGKKKMRRTYLFVSFLTFIIH